MPSMPSIPLTAISRISALRKYFNIFRVSLIERMAFRGDFFLGSVLRFLPMVTTILLWQAVFRGSEPELGNGSRKYSSDDMIAYLLLVHISRMFSSMPGLATGVAGEIRDGSLKKYLLQPLDMIGYLISYRMAHKAAYITMSALPYALLFFVCAFFGGYFHGVPDGPIWTAYLASLILSFLVGFFFELCIGMSGFWLLEVTSFVWIINTVTFFLSGHMFPLDLLKPWVSVLCTWLPFQYLAYFPAAVFLRKIEGAALLQGLLIELAWAVVLGVLARVLYLRGLRRYSAFGG